MRTSRARYAQCTEYTLHGLISIHKKIMLRRLNRSSRERKKIGTRIFKSNKVVRSTKSAIRFKSSIGFIKTMTSIDKEDEDSSNISCISDSTVLSAFKRQTNVFKHGSQVQPTLQFIYLFESPTNIKKSQTPLGYPQSLPYTFCN